jgi:hypothetical protein
MQTSNQFPQEPEESNEGSGAEQVSQPLYEFPVPYASWPEARKEGIGGETGVVSSTDPSKSASETDEQRKPEEDLIRQGLVYPPPPSFYQQSQVAHHQPLPPPSVPPPYPGMGGVGMQYGGIQPPPFAPAPPKKKSYKWLWITISIVGVLLLAACGVCGWAFSQFLTPIIQSETNAINVSNEYYAALQNKDYAGAYQYLKPQGSIQGMTQATFTQRAQSADNQYGAVRSYTTGSVNVVTDPNDEFNFSRFTVVVNVARASQSYSVLLTLVKSGNNWKIIDFDRV